MVGAPFFEELFFRGVLLRALARLFGTVGGLGGTGPGHRGHRGRCSGWPTPSRSSCSDWPRFGIILSFVSYRTGRLGMNMVAHATFNLMAVAAAVVAPLALAHGILS